MSKKTYSEKLKHPKWQRKRLEIMNRDNFKCKLCNDTETTLNVHHLSYSEGEPWDIENNQLITLCQECHHEVGLMENMDNSFTFHDIDILKYEYTNDTKILVIRMGYDIMVRLYKKNTPLDAFYLGIDAIEEIQKLKNKAKKFKRDLLF